MHQGRRRVPSEGEGKQKEHLDPLGQVRKDAGGDVPESALPQILRDVSEMIRAAVRTILRTKGLRQIEGGERQNQEPEERFPAEGHDLRSARKSAAGLLTSLPDFDQYRRSQTNGTQSQKGDRPRQPDGGQQKNGQAQDTGPNDKRE